MDDQKFQSEDELELIAILLVLWRRKLFILGFTGLIVAVLLYFIFSMQDIYRTSVVIEPVMLEAVNNGERNVIETPHNVKTLIHSETMREWLTNKISNWEEDGLSEISLKVKYRPPSNQLLVSMNYTDPEISTKAVNEIVSFLNKQYQWKIDDYILSQQEELGMLNSDKTESQEKLAEKRSDCKERIEHDLRKLKWLNLRITELLEEVSRSTANLVEIRKKLMGAEREYEILYRQQKMSLDQSSDVSDKIMARHNVVLSAKFQLRSLRTVASDLVSSVLRYKKELMQLELEKETLTFTQREFKNICTRLEREFEQDIDRLNLTIEMISKNIAASKGLSAIAIISPPRTEAKPVLPNRKVLITMSFVSSFFVAVILVFLAECIRKYKANRC